MVFPADVFDSHLRGDWVPLGSSPTKCQKKKSLLSMLVFGASESLCCLK